MQRSVRDPKTRPRRRPHVPLTPLRPLHAHRGPCERAHGMTRAGSAGAGEMGLLSLTLQRLVDVTDALRDLRVAKSGDCSPTRSAGTACPWGSPSRPTAPRSRRRRRRRPVEASPRGRRVRASRGRPARPPARRPRGRRSRQRALEVAVPGVGDEGAAPVGAHGLRLSVAGHRARNVAVTTALDGEFVSARPTRNRE